MKKRAGSLFLVLVMALSLLPVTARAGALDEGLLYEISGDHVQITGYTGDPADLVIPARIEGLPVTAIADFAFNCSYSLKSISIPKEVTSIGEQAFTQCYRLTGIHVDGDNPNYSSDDYGVLFDKEKNRLIQAPCILPARYEIPCGVKSIGDQAFRGCKDVTTVAIPDTVTTIGFASFADCTRLPAISIPCSVTSVGDQAFSCCESLTSIWIRDTLTQIGDGAFFNCSGMMGIYVDENNPNYSCDSQGVLFNKDQTQLIQAPGALTGSYAIPAGVTAIGDDGFFGCKKLTALTIPDSVKTIGSGAFSDCVNLFDISIPDGITSIGDYAFSHCEKLTRIDLPKGITAIRHGTFADCSKLTGVTIPDTVKTIGTDAFAYCESLSSVNIPGSVERIDDWAFLSCSSLNTIQFSGNAPEFGDYLFENVTATAYYPSGNSTWTADVMQSYGGAITWTPYTPSPFTDVPAGSFYETPVTWAVRNGITTGATADTFNPNGECLRAQVVTFLHRSNGNPEPSSTNNPFTDVKSSDFFYKPVLWAVEKGITNGVSGTKFGSYDVCNRAAVVTFLWRAAGSPEPKTTNNPFVDVKSTDFFYKSVLWAVEKGITNGVDATHFGPTSPCNRAQVVTFLYRACS